MTTHLLIHEPVLSTEVVSLLELPKRKCIIDATVGLGGHTEKILQSSQQVKVIGLDQDLAHLDFARQRLKKFGARFEGKHLNFAELEKIEEPFDGILFDLGIASPHVDFPERGFSFEKEGPLDMRMDIRQHITARDIIRDSSPQQLQKILSEYGEEREARKVALTLAGKDIATTTELAGLVSRCKTYRTSHHPATQVFQALRIAVNDELRRLKTALQKALDIMSPGGRIVVISYHSLEDRIVKQFFHQAAHPCICPPKVPICTCQRKPIVRIIGSAPRGRLGSAPRGRLGSAPRGRWTKKPVTPSEEEVRNNWRARSAKLRIAKKIELN